MSPLTKCLVKSIGLIFFFAPVLIFAPAATKLSFTDLEEDSVDCVPDYEGIPCNTPEYGHSYYYCDYAYQGNVDRMINAIAIFGAVYFLVFVLKGICKLDNG